MKRILLLALVCGGAVVLCAIASWFKGDRIDPAPHPYLEQLQPKPVSFVTCNSYPEYWDFAEYPYRNQAATQEHVRVHGILTFHNIPGGVDQIVEGNEIGEIKRVPGGPYRWCGSLGDSNEDERTGWRMITPDAAEAGLIDMGTSNSNNPLERTRTSRARSG